MPLSFFAWRMASSSTMPARAQLTIVAPFFMSASSFAPTIFFVSSFSGTWSVI